MLGLVIYPLVLIILIWPFGPPSLRLIVTLAAIVFFVSTAAIQREPEPAQARLWENVWAAVGILAVALAVGGSLLAFILGPG